MKARVTITVVNRDDIPFRKTRMRVVPRIGEHVAIRRIAPKTYSLGKVVRVRHYPGEVALIVEA